jgi:S-adenosylmethionine decarboxylase
MNIAQARQVPATGASSGAERARIGTQVVLDLYDCESGRLDDIEWVEATMLNAARAAGATIVESVFHQFSPWGISGTVIIAESHLAIHIWPEHCYAAIDVFTCGDTVQLDVAVRYLTKAFQSEAPVQRTLPRGERVAAPR